MTSRRDNLGEQVSPEALRLALALSPFERGLRESGTMARVILPCVRCERRDAEPGSLYCGPWCEADAELTALFAES